MIFFKSKKTEEIKKLLAASKQDFGFDKDNIKARLMMAVNSHHLSKEDVSRLNFKPVGWPKYAYSMALALVLMLGTTGFAFASNRATPGDILFPLQKLQNQVVLSLPLPESKKEEIRTEIVAKRLKELDDVQNNPNAKPAKVQAVVKESGESIDDAISHLPVEAPISDEKKTEDKSPRKDNRKFEKLLNRLDDLTLKHQTSLESIQTKSEDSVTKDAIEKSVTSVKSNREKLKIQRGNFYNKINSDSKNQDRDNSSKQKSDETTSSAQKNKGRSTNEPVTPDTHVKLETD